MKIKIIVFRLFCFLGIVGLSLCDLAGCSNMNESNIQELTLPNIVVRDQSAYIQKEYFTPNNTTPLADLLDESYTLSTLENFFQISTFKNSKVFVLDNIGRADERSWDEVHASFPIKCLRYNNNKHYSVYKVTEGGYYYVFWNVPLKEDVLIEPAEETDTIQVQATLYLNNLPSIQSFKSLKKNRSTAEDVYSIDPFMEMNFLSSLVSSYTRIDDNRIIAVRYTHTSLENLNDLIIHNIYLCSTNSSNAFTASILSEDLP